MSAVKAPQLEEELLLLSPQRRAPPGQTPGPNLSVSREQAFESWPRSVFVAAALPLTPHLASLPGDPLDGEREVPVGHATLPRSFSAPYPPLDSTTLDSWQWDQVWQQQQQPAEDLLAEEVYQQARRVEGYIAGLLQRYTLASRAWWPQTMLSPDTPHAASGHNCTHRKPPVFLTERLLVDPVLQAQADLSTNPTHQKWGRDLLEEEAACGVEAPSLEDVSDLALPYPQSGSQSLTESLPSPLPSGDPNGGPEAFEPPPPHNCIHPQPQTINLKHSVLGAPFIPGRAWLAPVHSPRPCNPTGSKSTQTATCADRPTSKPRSMKKNLNERPRAKKSSKTSRSQSENSLLGQPLLPERRYSTTGRHQGHQVAGPPPADGGHGGSRRWCSNLELSQDEGESRPAHVHKRQQRRARSGHPSSHDRAAHCSQHPRLRPDAQERAPLCQEEDSYAVAAAPAESESSMSELYSPASSSLSSDSDESGGLVWPQQLPPRFASTSSSSSPSPQAAANATCQPKAFVKIKASHALKRKILRFRSGSLKVMTTV